MTTERLVQQLAYSRIAMGLLVWLAPLRMGRLFRIDTSDAGATFLARVFAVREAALGVATLTAPEEARGALTRLALAVDGTDCAAAVATLRAGKPRFDASLLLGLGLMGVAVGAKAINEVQ